MLMRGESRATENENSNLEATPRGSRNKLSDAFLQALADDFEAHGKGVVEKVRTDARRTISR